MRNFGRSLVLVAVIVLGVSACVPTSSGDPKPTSSSSGSTAPSTSPGPPLPDDTSTVVPEPTPLEIEPVIVVAGIDVDGLHVSSSGYVAGIVEDGGTCTFTFSGSGASTDVSSVGRSDVRTTSCGLVQVPIEAFSRGTWTVMVTYSSEAVSATASEPTTLEIP